MCIRDRVVKNIFTPEGLAVYSSGSYTYEYFINDHLGSTRVAFDVNGSTATVVQQDDYYPFGMRHNPVAISNDNKYLYNGKELQDDMNLNWYDYGARYYDPQIARWHSPDPLAEISYDWTPYRYSFNNPIRYFDPTGLWEFATTDDGDKKRLQLQKSNDKDNLRTFRKESGLTNREIKNNLFGGGKEGKAAMKEFFGSGESSIAVSEFSGKTGTMLQGMETALNEGNAKLEATGGETYENSLGNCISAVTNLKLYGSVDNGTFNNDMTDPNSMLTLKGFDKVFDQFKNVKNPKLGDIIRFSPDQDKKIPAHAAMFLLNNSSKSGPQVFSKNGGTNSAPHVLTTQGALSGYGIPTGRTGDKYGYYR
jgi:RHS repeat-associated protein